MNYSYTQISQYLSCPRRYRHRYLDGFAPASQWEELSTTSVSSAPRSSSAEVSR